MVPNPTRISRPNRIPAALAAVIAVWSCAPVALGDARADYASLFGEEEKKVLATAFTKDDATFAAKLLARAGDLKDAPELQRLVLTRAVELGQKDADGLASAIDAAKQIIATAQGAEKLEWRGKLVDLYAAQYKRATGTKRAEAGEFLLGVLENEANALLAEAKYADSVKRLNEARDIARSIRSPRTDDFLTLAKDVQARQQTAEKYDRLRAKVEQQGGSTAGLEQLILGYLLEVEDTETAKKLAAGHPDKQWEKMIGLFSERENSLVLLEAAEWWIVTMQDRPKEIASLGLARAQVLCRAFLTAHKKQDAAGLRASQLSERVQKALDEVAGGATTATEVLVWNTNNNNVNDRGAKRIGVTLQLRGRVVWRSKLIPIPHQNGQAGRVVFTIPPVLFDSVVVSVHEWYGRGGGLAEVEVFDGTTQVGAGAKVDSSGAVTADFAASALTDGVIEGRGYKGYWLLPDNVSGWAKVDIRTGQKIAGKR